MKALQNAYSGTSIPKGSSAPAATNEEISIALGSILNVLNNFVSSIDKFSFQGGQSIANLYSMKRGLLTTARETVIQWICIGLLRGFKLDKMFKDQTFKANFENSARTINLWWKGKDNRGGGRDRPAGNEMRLSTLLQVFGPLTANISSWLFQQDAFVSRYFKYDEWKSAKFEPAISWVGSYVICGGSEDFVTQAIRFHEWYISVRSRPNPADKTKIDYYKAVNKSWIGKQLEAFSTEFLVESANDKLPVKAAPGAFTVDTKKKICAAAKANLWLQESRKPKDEISVKVLDDLNHRLSVF